MESHPSCPSSKFLKQDEITECIFSKIYTQVCNIKELDEIEIEVRLGWISYIAAEFSDLLFMIPHGIVLPINKYNETTIYNFNPGVYKKHFLAIMKKFDEFSELPPESGECSEFLLGVIAKGEVQKLEPLEYQDSNYSKSLRVTYDSNGEATKAMKKVKLYDIDYFNHGYDFRVSISNEIPQKIELNKTSEKPQIIRKKKLNSYKFNNLVFDFKEVVEIKKDKEFNPKYEVEIEIENLPELMKENGKQLYETIKLMIHFAGFLYFIN